MFKGAKPADLPVEHPTKFELLVNVLLVNVKTAAALGLRFSNAARYRRRDNRIVLLFAAVSPLIAPNRIYRAGLLMSVIQGRPEVAGGASNRSF
jgi:hypothetical protein